MNNIQIKVTTETLISVSADVRQKISNVENAFDEIDSIVSGTSWYWEGDGQRGFREYYNIRRDDYTRILHEFKTHIDNLQEIAGVYQETEKTAVSTANMLLGDVIV